MQVGFFRELRESPQIYGREFADDGEKDKGSPDFGGVTFTIDRNAAMQHRMSVPVDHGGASSFPDERGPSLQPALSLPKVSKGSG